MEYVSLRDEAVGAIIIGDINVHCASWLKYSSQGNTPEGELLRETCNFLGIKQIVKEPTREKNLLDLIPTDICGVEYKKERKSGKETTAAS